jgi:hypothetical protein
MVEMAAYRSRLVSVPARSFEPVLASKDPLTLPSPPKRGRGDWERLCALKLA